jgi:hypothetical protein
MVFSYQVFMVFIVYSKVAFYCSVIVFMVLIIHSWRLPYYVQWWPWSALNLMFMVLTILSFLFVHNTTIIHHINNNVILNMS